MEIRDSGHKFELLLRRCISIQNSVSSWLKPIGKNSPLIAIR